MAGNLKDSKQDANSEPSNLKDLSVESTVKDSDLVTKLTNSNLAESMVVEQQIAGLDLPDSKLINLMLADTKQTDSKLACSVLGNLKLADLDAQDDSKVAKPKLCVLGIPESKLLEVMLPNLEVTESKLSDSMLNDLNVIKSMLTNQKLSTPKLPDSHLLCETESSQSSSFPIKRSRKKRKPDCCLLPPSSEKYSFLLKSDFLLLSASFLFLAFGCTLPFVYLVPYSLSVDISHHQSVLLMSILGAMGIVGNITFGWISDRK